MRFLKIVLKHSNFWMIWGTHILGNLHVKKVYGFIKQPVRLANRSRLARVFCGRWPLVESWRFPESCGYPQIIIHMLDRVFPDKNHPAIGYPHDELETSIYGIDQLNRLRNGLIQVIQAVHGDRMGITALHWASLKKDKLTGKSGRLIPISMLLESELQTIADSKTSSPPPIRRHDNMGVRVNLNQFWDSSFNVQKTLQKQPTYWESSRCDLGRQVVLYRCCRC